MTSVQLTRIRMPSADAFERDYMSRLRPVVITDLFAGDPIRALDSKEKVIAEWGGIRIPVDDDYDAAIGIDEVRRLLRARDEARGISRDGSSVRPAPPTMSIADYFALVHETGGAEKPRVAFAPPSEIAGYLRVPPFCRSVRGESDELTRTCFVGTKGSFSQLHFDKCGSHGLLYSVYGTKRFIVIPPEASRKLAAFTQFSAWLITNFSDSDREAFLRFVGGAEVILQPGEAIYMPPFCWHFADYFDDCWGINMRFRRSERVKTVVNAFFPDVYMQAIGAKLADPKTPEDVYRAVTDAILTAQANRSPDGYEQTLRMRRLARDLCARLFPSSPPGPYATHDAEEVFPSPLPHLLDAYDARRPVYS